MGTVGSQGCWSYRTESHGFRVTEMWGFCSRELMLLPRHHRAQGSMNDDDLEGVAPSLGGPGLLLRFLLQDQALESCLCGCRRTQHSVPSTGKQRKIAISSGSGEGWGAATEYRTTGREAWIGLHSCSDQTLHLRLDLLRSSGSESIWVRSLTINPCEMKTFGLSFENRDLYVWYLDVWNELTDEIQRNLSWDAMWSGRLVVNMIWIWLMRNINRRTKRSNVDNVWRQLI